MPLIAQEKLIGLLALGPKLSGEVYTSWDRELLSALSDRAAICITIGQLVSQVKARERVDQELRVAQEIQTSFLPEVCPRLPGFHQAEEEFRRARLTEVIVQNRDLTTQGVIERTNEEVATFVGGEPQFDDFTSVVLKCFVRRDCVQAMGLDGRWPL